MTAVDVDHADRRRTWRVLLPSLTPVTLNDRLHRQQHAARMRDWRVAAGWCARADRVPALDRIYVELHATPPTRRRRDADNLAPCVKACIDGLRDAGVIPDDTPDHVAGTHVTVSRDVDPLGLWRWTLHVIDTTEEQQP